MEGCYRHSKIGRDKSQTGNKEDEKPNNKINKHGHSRHLDENSLKEGNIRENIDENHIRKILLH